MHGPRGLTNFCLEECNIAKGCLRAELLDVQSWWGQTYPARSLRSLMLPVCTRLRDLDGSLPIAIKGPAVMADWQFTPPAQLLGPMLPLKPPTPPPPPPPGAPKKG